MLRKVETIDILNKEKNIWLPTAVGSSVVFTIVFELQEKYLFV